MLLGMKGYGLLGPAVMAIAACGAGCQTTRDGGSGASRPLGADATRPDAARRLPNLGRDGSLVSPDGGPDAASARLLDGGNGQVCEPGTRECRNPDDLVYSSVRYTEDPVYDDDYNSGDYERTLRVGKRLGPLDGTSQTGAWLTAFDVVSDRPSKGTLAFDSRPGWAVLELPTTVHLHVFWKASDCIAPGPEHPEAVAVAQDVVRDASGALLIARGINPMRPDGTVMMASGSIPELGMRWRDVGCPICWSPGMSIIARGKGVELDLALVGTGEVVQAPIGERTQVKIGNTAYVFVPRWASVPVGGESPCGSAGWTLYRPDVLVEVPEAMAPGP